MRHALMQALGAQTRPSILSLIGKVDDQPLAAASRWRVWLEAIELGSRWRWF